ncbi:MAG: trehalose-phosphatase [Candidatus Zixiibacteriota bacterium]
MLRLIQECPRIEKKILGKKLLFIGLDYDGTLTPIVSHPDQARLPQGIKSLLANLCDRPNVLVCVISGRSCEDIKKKVGIKGIIYAGNHGMEIRGRGLSFSIRNSNKYTEETNKICRNLNQRLKRLKSVWVENKGLSASVHYRLAKPAEVKNARQIVFSSIETYKDLELKRGKKVWEIRPNIDWNKGKAVTYILEKCLTKEWKSKSAAVYMGDDQTDEDAFSLLREDGITILVSRRPSRRSDAQYFLTHAQVMSFLRWLGNLWKDKDEKPKSARKDSL